jgi:hypothetical protein
MHAAITGILAAVRNAHIATGKLVAFPVALSESPNTARSKVTTVAQLGLSAEPNVARGLLVQPGLGLKPSPNGVVGTSVATIGLGLYQPNYVAQPTDPYFANVRLLLQGDGANGATTTTDSSGYHRTISMVGGAQLSSTQSKFGGTSMQFGTLGSHVMVPNSTDFDLGSSNFTIEWWQYLNAFTMNAESFQRITPTSYQEFLEGGDGSVEAYVGNSGGFFYLYPPVLVLNAWQHLAMVRNGNVFTFYANGVAKSTFTTASASSAGTSPLYIGGTPSPSVGYPSINGYIDGFRWTHGIARYTTGFTPPTAAFPNQ